MIQSPKKENPRGKQVNASKTVFSVLSWSVLLISLQL